MHFEIKIELGNDAMQTWEDIRLALRESAVRIGRAFQGEPMAGDSVAIFDVNGNRVGVCKVIP